MKIEDLENAWRKKGELDELVYTLEVIEASKCTSLSLICYNLQTPSRAIYISDELKNTIANLVIQEYKQEIAKIEKEIEEL